MFKDLDIQTEYRSGKNNVIKDFFIPVLSSAVKYKRAVGFFSSSALIDIAKGITGLLNNNGTIELIVSPHLSKEDIEAIDKGYIERNKAIENAIMKEFVEPKSYFESERLNILANLIANEKLDIKVAFTREYDCIGLYHEKMGLVYDTADNVIAFSGSTNETGAALKVNYEVIDVFCSWQTEFEQKKVYEKEFAFHKLWTNADSSVQILDFPEVAKEKLQSYRKDQIDICVDNKEAEEIEIAAKSKTIKTNGFCVPKNVDFYDYQKVAIDNWKKKNYQGIFDMATGTGKTFTALGALSMLSKNVESFVTLIVCPYQHLVEQWVEDIENFGVKPIVAYSAYIDWKELFSDSINAYKTGVKKFFCVVTTNATFETDNFQKLLMRIKKNLCIVVDEAHNFGSTKLSSMLPMQAKYRLALSATIERYRDEEGTNKIVEYFGEKCISYTLQDAISKGFLTSYYYYPVLVYLSPDELDEYVQLTKRIAKLGAIAKDKPNKNSNIELLLLQRARIVAGAQNKIKKLLSTIEPYSKDSHMLVYCGATKYDRTDIDDAGEIKQIDLICKMLNSELNMKVRKFTSEEDRKERITIKEDFKEGVDLQVIAAIKCLDEGVNIPAIKRAFILASSTNPKEYIQRRGRVLRKFEGKEYSEIFDFITLPRPLEDVEFCSSEEIRLELSLIKKEFVRMMDFANSARNPFEIDELKEQILKAYRVYDLRMEDTEYE